MPVDMYCDIHKRTSNIFSLSVPFHLATEGCFSWLHFSSMAAAGQGLIATFNANSDCCFGMTANMQRIRRPGFSLR